MGVLNNSTRKRIKNKKDNKVEYITQGEGGCILGLHQNWPAVEVAGSATVERRLHRVTRCVIRSKRLKKKRERKRRRCLVKTLWH